MTALTPKKHRHHFVPITYLSQWADRKGKIWAYRSENPTAPFHLKPAAVAFEKHYYSQLRDDQSVDTNSLEDFCSAVETLWTPIMEKITARQDVNACMVPIFQFMSLQRVRVPAARDAAQSVLAGAVEMTFKFMLEKDLLPPVPAVLEGKLDRIRIAIEPWKSLEAMAPIMQGFARVIDRMGFEIVHLEATDNMTFITSDNPVVYFDPDCHESCIQPYRPSPHGKQELLFPIGPRTLIRGHTDLKHSFGVGGFRHVSMCDRRAVMRVNRFIARFGYRLRFTRDRSHDRLIAKYGSEGPVITNLGTPVQGGRAVVYSTAFGPRKPKTAL